MEATEVIDVKFKIIGGSEEKQADGEFVFVDKNGSHFAVYWELKNGEFLDTDSVRCKIPSWTLTHGGAKSWGWILKDKNANQPALLVPKTFVFVNKVFAPKKRLLELFYAIIYT